jgi:diacylglycerol kinase family enzyme
LHTNGLLSTVLSAMPVDVVVNRTARHLGDGSALRELIVREAARAGARLYETGSLDELDDVARDIAGRGTEAVVLAGGDGSHMGGLSALARAFGGTLPAVALAPGGTVCTVARNLGMRGPARVWAERVVRAACARDARPVEHATLRVRDDAGGDRVGFIFGAGLVARFFDEYYGGGPQGILPAAGIAARVFAGSLVGSALARRVLSPAACTVTVDGETHATRAWSLVLASVVRDVGLHVRATYRAGDEPGRFHVVASGLSPRGLALQVPRVLSGRAMRGGPRVDALATSLRVAFQNDDRGAYVLDGDAMRAQEVRIAAGPLARVLTP